MAFMGIFFVALVIVIAVIVLFTVLGTIFLIISAVKHRKWKKQMGKRKTYLVFRVLGIICMLPLIIVIIMIPCDIIKSKIRKHSSLSYNVMHGNFEDVERILESGVSPDCTLDGNDPAKPGEQTLLSVLCENGFTDMAGDPYDDEETEEELKMIQLLVDYGADIESTTYHHEETDPCHQYNEESDYYNSSDKCGYTPLLFAVYHNRIETVKLLVENGADINTQDFCGFNAIATVADNMSDNYGVEILGYLLEHGGNKNAVTKYGQTISFLASRHNSNFQNEEIREILGCR